MPDDKGADKREGQGPGLGRGGGKTFEVKRWHTFFTETGPEGGFWKAELVGLSWRASDRLVEETWKWTPPSHAGQGAAGQNGGGKQGKRKDTGKGNKKGKKGKGKDTGKGNKKGKKGKRKGTVKDNKKGKKGKRKGTVKDAGKKGNRKN